ncbi:MAG: hypothetical protein AB7F89_15620, partial [Pirellulaceae bacterium]
MVLRTLVTNYLREQAQAKIYEAARQSLHAQPDGPPAPPPTCEIAIVFATGVEAGGLVDTLEQAITTRCANFDEHTGIIHGRPVVLVESGVGRVAASSAAAEVITLHQVQSVISAGFGTALEGTLKRGHIVMADEVTDLHGRHFPVPVHIQRESLVNNPSLHLGRQLTVEHPLRSAEEKHRLGENHGALCADMESIGVVELCQQRQLPFVSVRIITDTVDDELPPEIVRMLDLRSLAGNLGAAAGALFKLPSTIKG